MYVARRPQGVTSVIAHRGASRAEPENTVAAFRRAASMGADMVELDVRRSADGFLVVHHDPHLRDGESVAATAAADLPTTVPTLQEALAACDGMVVNIEIKNDPAETGFEADRRLSDDVVALVVERDVVDRVLVSSFDLASLERVKECGPPTIATAWLVVTSPADVVEVLLAGGHDALHPWWLAVDPGLVERCHAADIAVNVWTCDDPDAMVRLAEMGVDGICTNAPDVAAGAVARRPSAQSRRRARGSGSL